MLQWLLQLANSQEIHSYDAHNSRHYCRHILLIMCQEVHLVALIITLNYVIGAGLVFCGSYCLNKAKYVCQVAPRYTTDKYLQELITSALWPLPAGGQIPGLIHVGCSTQAVLPHSSYTALLGLFCPTLHLRRAQLQATDALGDQRGFKGGSCP